jgi:hypothetical protein
MLASARRLAALASEKNAVSRCMSSWAVREGEPSPSISDAHGAVLPAFNPPERLLMGPGPANAHPRVLAAQAFPLLGHMHAPYFKIMDEVQEGLRCVAASASARCFPPATRLAARGRVFVRALLI